MRNIFYFIILILLQSCDSHQKTNRTDTLELPERVVYVSEPNKKDKLCISEINRAKDDIKKGKVVFTQSFGLGTEVLNYEKELKELCKTRGLVFDIDLISCIEYEGQTQGCYGDYMDKEIIERFGISFKKDLHREANRLFLLKNID